jgi:hypothetical protein
MKAKESIHKKDIKKKKKTLPIARVYQKQETICSGCLG